MEFESNNPDEGTALTVDEAAALIGQQSDVHDDSAEHTAEHVETPTTEEVVETIEDQFFDVNGEQISLNDLKSGFMKHADYTRKTQEIAEQRRVYQQNQRDINEVRNQALQHIESVKQELAIQFKLTEQPDWNFLLENDPGLYVQEQAKWQQREAAVRQLYETEVALKQQAAAFEEEQHKAALQESNARFYEKYPDLKDRTKAAEAFDKITSFLLETGFAAEEIQGISDFRIIDVMYQFVNLLEKQKAVPEVVAKIEQKPVISQKAGSRKSSDYERVATNFNKSPDVHSAAALLRQSNF